MSEEEPADDSATGVKRHDHFGCEGVEGAAHDGALRGIYMREVRARDEVRVHFKPADERITLAVFDVVRFRQTAESSAQSIPVALPHLRENSDASNAGRIGDAFHHICEQGF